MIDRTPRRIDRPEPGFWAVRLVSGAPEVGACIRWERTEVEPGEPTNRMDRSPILTARINGEIVPIDEVWTRRGRPISEAEYRYLVADRQWAKRWAPHLPEANPYRRIDPRQVAPVRPPALPRRGRRERHEPD